jgi:hypothetical protein
MYPSFGRTVIVVSYGAGVDSTALLIGLWSRGIRPDYILFADTGGELTADREELAGAYLQVWRMQLWCERVGFPSIQVVRYAPKRAKYTTLEELCHVNETLPSLAFGHHSCSLKFKRDPQNAFLKRELKAFFRDGGKVLKLVGYDNGSRDCKRSAKRTYAGGAMKPAGKDPGAKWEAKHVDSFVYPLQEWGWTREHCEQVCNDILGYVPRKTSCYFCPAARPDEVAELATTHPELYARGVAMEERARNGKHGLKTTKGLGRNFAWATITAREPEPVA